MKKYLQPFLSKLPFNKKFFLLGIIALFSIATTGFLLNYAFSVTSREKSIILFRETGLVQYKSASDDDSSFKAVDGSETYISTNTTIKTIDAFAHLLFPDSSIMSLDPNTIVTIEYSSDVKTVIKQVSGNTWNRVKKITDTVNGGYEVHTPNATAAVRGTEFKVETDWLEEKKMVESEFYLTEGEIIVEDQKTKNQAKVYPGKKVKLRTRNQQTSPIRPVSNQEQENKESQPTPEDTLIIEDIPEETLESEEFKRNKTISEVLPSSSSREEKLSTLKGISENLKIQLYNRVITRGTIKALGEEDNEGEKTTVEVDDSIVAELSQRSQRRVLGETEILNSEPTKTVREILPPAKVSDTQQNNQQTNTYQTPLILEPVPDRMNDQPIPDGLSPKDTILLHLSNRSRIKENTTQLQERKGLLLEVISLFEQRIIENRNSIVIIDSQLSEIEFGDFDPNLLNELRTERRTKDFENIRLEAKKTELEDEIRTLDQKIAINYDESIILRNTIIEINDSIDDEIFKQETLARIEETNFDPDIVIIAHNSDEVGTLLNQLLAEEPICEIDPSYDGEPIC